MFAWLKSYDTLEEIPEGARDAYEEKEGAYQLIDKLDGSGADKTLRTLRSEIKTLKRENGELKEASAKFEELDLDEDKIASLTDDLEELEELREMRKSGNLEGESLAEEAKKLSERQIANLEASFDRERKKHAKELEKAQGERDTALASSKDSSAKLNELTVDHSARALATKYKIAGHAIDDVLLHVKSNFEMDPDGGDEPVSRSGDGTTLKDWFEDTVPNKPGWTFDPQASGSGAAPGGKGAGVRTVKRADFEKLPPAEQVAMATKANTGEVQLVD